MTSPLPFNAGQALTAAQLDATVPTVIYMTGQTVNSTASVPVSGAGWAVSPGQYRLSGIIFGTQGTTAAIQAVGVSGPATSACDIEFFVTDTTSGVAAVLNAFEITGMGTRGSLTGSGPVANHTFTVKFQGAITFTAAGTLQLTASCVTSGADTWTIRTGFAELYQG